MALRPSDQQWATIHVLTMDRGLRKAHCCTDNVYTNDIENGPSWRPGGSTSLAGVEAIHFSHACPNVRVCGRAAGMGGLLLLQGPGLIAS